MVCIVKCNIFDSFLLYLMKLRDRPRKEVKSKFPLVLDFMILLFIFTQCRVMFRSHAYNKVF